MAEGKKLERQAQTVINYLRNGGNMKRAMIDAGYSESYADANARYLMGIIGPEIRAAQEQAQAEGIKSVQDVQKFWSTSMDNDDIHIKQRLKASELLVKSLGGFIDRVEVQAAVKLEDIL